MRSVPALACAAGLTFLSSQALAWGWATGEGGYSPDYYRLGLSGGLSLDRQQHVLLQAGAGEAVARNGNPRQETRAMDYNLGIGIFPHEMWDLSLDGSFAHDSSRQLSGGGDLALGLHRTEGAFKPSLTVKVGGARHFLNFNNTTQRLASSKEGLVLGLGLGEIVSVGASANLYQYSADPYGGLNVSNSGVNPSDSGGFLPFVRPFLPAPRGTQSGQRSGSVRNDLLFGFPERDWSAGVTLTFPIPGTTLSGDYTQVEDANSGAWLKSVGAALRQEFGEEKCLAAKLGWAKAVESGSGDAFFSAGLTYYFREKSGEPTVD